VDQFGVAIGVAKRKVIKITSKYTAKRKWSFCLSAFLRGSGTYSTGFLIFPCLKKPNKIENEVWFCVVMIISSIITVFFIIKINAGLLSVFKFCLFVQGI
jgi:hypothetical protein